MVKAINSRIVKNKTYDLHESSSFCGHLPHDKEHKVTDLSNRRRYNQEALTP